MELVTPNWQGDYWMRVLEKISTKQVCLRATANLFKGDWDKKHLPAPKWETLVTYIDTAENAMNLQELDPKICKHLQKMNRNWDLLDMKREMREYPRFPNSEVIEKEIQVEQPDLPDLSPIKSCKQEMFSIQEMEEHETYLQEMANNMEILNDIVEAIDLEFQKYGHVVQETSQMIQTIKFSDDCQEETEKACPSSNFTINEEIKEEIANLVKQ